MTHDQDNFDLEANAVAKIGMFGPLAGVEAVLAHVAEEGGLELAVAMACMVSGLTDDEKLRLARATDRGAVLAEILGDEEATVGLLTERFGAFRPEIRGALREAAHLTPEEASAFAAGTDGAAKWGARCIWACLEDGRL